MEKAISGIISFRDINAAFQTAAYLVNENYKVSLYRSENGEELEMEYVRGDEIPCEEHAVLVDD